jgi:hypothetical protein
MSTSNGNDNRTAATVTRIEQFFCLALDDGGAMYLLPAKNFEVTGRFGFAHLKYGSRVSFIPIEGPKGPRGLEVRIDQV